MINAMTRVTVLATRIGVKTCSFSTMEMNIKKPPNPIPDRNASMIPCRKVLSPALGDLLSNQMPINASANPPSWVGLGRPTVSIPNTTGSMAQVIADVGATLAVFPMDNALYNAAIPKAPAPPARAPHKTLRPGWQAFTSDECAHNQHHHPRERCQHQHLVLVALARCLPTAEISATPHRSRGEGK